MMHKTNKTKMSGYNNSAIIPFTAGSPIMVSGPTQAGKTFWIKKLLTNNMFTKPISSVLYCYGVYQKSFEDMQTSTKIEFHEGLPSLEKIQQLNNGQFHVIVLDDLMEQIVKSIDVQNLFTRLCHHYNITAIFVTQNIFVKGPYSRTVSLNTHIIVLFANKRDESQASHLGRQLYPGNSKMFLEAYEDATSKRYGYLLIDCTPQSPKQLKLRTHIFPGEQTVVYMKK